MFHVDITRPDFRNRTEIRILQSTRDSDKIRLMKINEKGDLLSEEYGAYDDVPPTFTLQSLGNPDIILQAFADALGKINIYPQATNKDKIKAEAISEEKESQIQWLRGMIENKWGKNE